ncbi:GIY-YIG nuclease family protein [Acidocella aromatica]|uniref:GIY-YIG domain-containing protein n=1 Tax=Acidocella aromatica TaxID=1303579 RepID=A0A840VDK9_9PROT|nr:hypothetical protein [Acidocella aromatica]MBB5373943.1 hypothetical protein [Acidocella aromatica]
MDLTVEWLDPVQLKDGSAQQLIYTCDMDDLPTDPGIYVFERHWNGQMCQALYVGKAQNIRKRIVEHFKGNVQLMNHIQGAPNGAKCVRAGVFRALPGQQAARLTCSPGM